MHHEATVADALLTPYRLSVLDFAISIAVIHHLSTSERRISAIRALLDVLKPDIGRGLIYVWALEQRESRRGWDKGDDQDVMVPWVKKSSQSQKKIQQTSHKETDSPLPEIIFQRYYHLYREGELEQEVKSAGGIVINMGYEKDNWWAIISK